MLKQNNSMFFKRCFAIILCVICLFAGVSSFFSTISVNSETINNVSITFTQGSDVTAVNSSLTLFEDTTTKSSVSTNASGCLVVPETYFDIYGESTDYGDLPISLDSTYYSSTSANILDCETFYFDVTTTDKSDSWAYSFTGWKISVKDGNGEETVTDKIPEQTVFQPGDVITPDILTKYATDSNNDGTYELTLEALWGKCYFIQNEYKTMVYNQNSSGVYELDTTESTGETGARDSNTGNNPANPKATIDGLYADLRGDENKTVAFVDYDAYATVVMLTGDLNYYKDNNVSTTYNNSGNYYYYYGYGAETNITTNNNINANTEYVSATYKSLQADRTYDNTNTKWVTSHSSTTKGTKYTYYYKGRGNYNYIYGNMRLDNILFRKTKSGDIGNVTTSEFQLYHNSNDTGLHYFETTARYNVYTNNGTTTYITSGEAAFSSLRTADHEYIVLNGGQIGNMEFYWSSNIKETDRYWYIGRLACVNNYITVGCTTTAESLVYTVKCNMTITVTGGKIGYITGSSKGMNSISVGNRTVNVYGDGTKHVSADTGTMKDYEYNPYITGLYGGGYTSPLYGDVVVNVDSCTNLVNVYGGGKDYSATTYGNVTLNITDCNITEYLYGGGQYANVEIIPSTYTQYSYSNNTVSSTTASTGTGLGIGSSKIEKYGGDVEINLSGTTVGKSVYGSGMGQTQTISVLSSEIYTDASDKTSTSYTIEKTDNKDGTWSYTYEYPSDWNTEPTFPKYDSTTGYVLIGSYKYITWSSASPSAVNFRRYDYYAYLSLATVQNVEINITDGSYVYGSVYGGGSIAKVLGNSEVNIEDSTVEGTVYGGGDGATTPSTVTVYQTGNKSDWTYSVTTYDSASGTPTSVSCTGTYTKLESLTVLGTFTWSGDESVLKNSDGIDKTNKLLYSPNTSGLGAVYGNTSVTISGSSNVGNVYGGGNQGAVYGDISVTVTGGTVGIIYGGCRAADVGTVKDNGEISGGDITVTVSGATIAGIYGGNNASGTIYGDINVSISGGEVTGSLYGGGNLATYSGTITVNVTGGTIKYFYGGGLGSDSDATAGGVNIVNINISQDSGSTTIDSLYGGGYKGPAGSTYITVASGKITYIYGGGNNGDVSGNTSVNISGGALTMIYGGGLNGAVAGSTSVTISGGEMSTVYGGGNKGTAGSTSVKITGGSITNCVYGGGNEGAVSGSSSVELSGSTTSITNTIFGGGNKASVGSASLTVTSGSFNKTNNILYGGGNEGAVLGNISVAVSGGTIRTLYGGCNKADVSGTIEVEVTGGTITTLYGANNVSGTVSGSTVKVSVSGSTTSITTLYGGGNEANYSGAVTVDVTDATIGTLYGGGYSADVGSASLTISSGKITNNIYGGGYAGAVTGSTTVELTSGSAAKVYGGGYGSTATVGGNATVTITDSSVSGDVYGGGEQGAVSGSSTVSISQDSGTTTISGGVYGGGYSAGVGSASVSITSGTVTGSVYGGGYAGNVGSNNSAGSTSVTVGGNVGENSTGSIYGGGYNGAVYGNASVTVSGSVADSIYGGGYGETATVTGSATVSSSNNVGGSIYGGGENGDVLGATSVTVTGGTVTGSVYGGGLNGDVGTSSAAVTAEVAVSGGTIANVYGGGYVGDIYGTTTVSISDSSTATIISGGVYGAGYGADACVTSGTAVTINLTYKFTAKEDLADETSTSGEITTTITGDTSYTSVIKGNVYGGGNLGTVGAGTINTSTNNATITSAATTSVTVVSGHIEGSVYGGGYGVPTSGSYNIYMGTVFGSTAVSIAGEDGNDYIYIENNIFGGGSQSRVYAEDGGTAATLSISSANGAYIAIGGSVFGGGERGNSATTNASVPTTIGNVSVTITGNSESAAATIYFVSGGVYGDGNLCLVSGTRTINITNFITGSSDGSLKTFYSLQRADTATLSNSKIVLLGAKDLVAEGDSTTYSINRIESLSLTNGSTIKLDRIVNYLGALSSDVYSERVFVSGGYNGSNTYNTNATVYALSAMDISSYITDATEGKTVLDTNKYANTVCVANGLSLELKNTNGNYGAVTGLFTLSLLREIEGEGGGFVYASISDSTGDFICITKFSGSTEYMTVVDDVGGYVSGSGYSYYYWYIQGSTINYTLEVTGYIGSTDTDYQDGGTVPRHDATRHYVLKTIEVNSDLSSALVTNTTYTLVQTSTGLTDQQISIEIMIGDTSLGFLYYDSSNGWGIYQSASKIYYSGDVYTNNDLASLTVTNSTDTIYFILHKSSDVNTEVSGMTVTVTIDIYADNGGGIGDRISSGTNELIVECTASIVRLVPTQTIYKTSGKNYAGIDTSVASISITLGSSFTMQYQTKYIPAAFSSSSGTMTWAISTQGYAYYMDTNGNYLTINTTTGACASISSSLTYVGTEPTSPSIWNVYYDSTGYYYYTSYTNTSNYAKVSMTLQNTFTAYTIPAGTKITLVDLTSGSAVYYYYVCTAETDYIDLDSFMKMGTSTTIAKLTSEGSTPAYKAAYTSGYSSTQVTENLIFIFDFEDAVSTMTAGDFSVQLQHLYEPKSGTYATDIMDFVQTTTDSANNTSYTRSWPTLMSCTFVSDSAYTLSAKFESSSYYDLDTAVLNVTITPSGTDINTRLLEYECALKIELVNGSGEALSFPVGMQFEYNGTVYDIAASGNYVIIPLGTLANTASANTFVINIINELYSLSEVYGNGATTAYFKVTMYSAPNGSYYNYISWSNVIDSYTINENLTYALSVTPTTTSGNDTTTYSQVRAAGEKLTFTVTTACSGSSSENVYVTLMVKTTIKNDAGEEENVYVDSDLSDLFADSLSEIDANTDGADYTWTINSSASAGTYRLVFNYGDHVEYLNVIVYE